MADGGARRAGPVLRLKRALKRLGERAGYTVTRVRKEAPAPVPRVVVNAHYRGHCFRCFAGDPQCETILRGEGWDNQLEEILAELDDGGGHVVEIGANIGGSLVPRAGEHPGLAFHCVEPVPAFYNLLEQNASSYGAPNVRLYHRAITARDGEMVEVHAQLGTAGRLAEYDFHPPMETLRLEGVTVDSLFAELRVRLLKIDTDGFEVSVLQGAERMLRSSRPLIFMEFHAKLIRSAGGDPAELTAILERYGYRPERVWDNFGAHLMDTDSFADLLEAADGARYYVDALFRPAP